MFSNRCMYLIVVRMSLCLSVCCTCTTLLVLWYSFEALKCLKSYRRICLIVGSCSLVANAFLILRYSSQMLSDVVGNSLLFRFKFFLVMYAFSMSNVRGFSFPFPLSVCFAPMIPTVPLCRSMSPIFSHVSSMGLVPKSFVIDKKRLIRCLAFEINRSIFSSVGILIGLS